MTGQSALATGGAPGAASRKVPWIGWLFRRYARLRVRRAFSAVHVSGLDSLRKASESGPLIVALNHITFWDVFVLMLLEEALGVDAFALMDRSNLERLPFFGWLGALPLDRSHPRAAHRELLAAGHGLDRPSRVLFIFPQGEQRPSSSALRFQSGVGLLSLRFGLPVVPAALRYEFGEDPKPCIFVSLGTPLLPGSSARETTQRVAAGVSAELARIDAHLESGGTGFLPLVSLKAQRLPAGSRVLVWLAARGQHT